MTKSKKRRLAEQGIADASLHDDTEDLSFAASMLSQDSVLAEDIDMSKI